MISGGIAETVEKASATRIRTCRAESIFPSHRIRTGFRRSFVGTKRTPSRIVRRRVESCAFVELKYGLGTSCFERCKSSQSLGLNSGRTMLRVTTSDLP